MTFKYDYLVFIGRLQPPTRAHEQIIRTALSLSQKVIVVLGSSNSARTLRNPFTFEERSAMVLSMFDVAEQARILFVAQDDHTYQDQKWLVTLQQNVKHMILSHIPGNSERVTLHGVSDVNIGLIGHSKDETSYYLNLFPGWGNENVSALKGVDATAVRDAYFDQHPEQIDPAMVHPTVMATLAKFTATDAYQTLVQERAFVRKYQQQWANSPYPPTFVTGDACVTSSGYVLMIKRAAMPGKGMWALPGGFINQREKILDGVIRELREETRIKVPEPVLRGSIVKSGVYDDPHRSSRGRTITHAYHIKLPNTTTLPKVKGGDDAAEAQWVKLSDLRASECFEDHYFVICDLLGI
jgi:bifunctional NMN adenylyltransferase/nudix hydrolase